MRKLQKRFFEMVANRDIVGVKDLIKQGLTPNIATTKEKITPLMVAVRNNDVVMTKLLIENRANVDNAQDYQGRDAYDYADKYGSRAALMILLTCEEELDNAG